LIKTGRKIFIYRSAAMLTTDLYRHLDADGNLLYVGVSVNALTRLSGHRSVSHWYDNIATVEIVKYPTRVAALAAENEAILNDEPEHNISRGKQWWGAYRSPKQTDAARAAREALLGSIVFHPIYSTSAAAMVLDMSATRVKNLCISGELGCIDNGTTTRVNDGGKKTYQRFLITGWQIIDYLEALSVYRPPVRTGTDLK
jgi:hypothetical protein